MLHLEADANRVGRSLEQRALVRIPADEHGFQQKLWRILELYLRLAVSLDVLNAQKSP